MILRKLKEFGFLKPAMAGSTRDERNTRDAYSAGFLFGQTKHFSAENRIPFYAFEPRSESEVEEEVYEWLREVKPDVFISYWNNLVKSVIRLNLVDGHPCRFVCAAGNRSTQHLGGSGVTM